MRKRQSILFLSKQSAKTGTKIYSLTQCSLSVNECDWHILEDNDERIRSHCLPFFQMTTSHKGPDKIYAYSRTYYQGLNDILTRKIRAKPGSTYTPKQLKQKALKKTSLYLMFAWWHKKCCQKINKSVHWFLSYHKTVRTVPQIFETPH